MIQLIRRADLHELAVFQDRDAVGDAEGFLLIVRDVDGGEAGRLADATDLGTHLVTQLCIEIAEWFIEQEAIRLDGERAGEGDALLLAAGEFVRATLGVFVHLDELEHFIDASGAGFDRRVADIQAELHVLPDGHVGPQRVALEAHDGVAAIGAERRHVPIVEHHSPAARAVQAGDEAEQCAFAATAGSEEEEEFAGFDFEIDFVEGNGRAESFGDFIEMNARHAIGDCTGLWGGGAISYVEVTDLWIGFRAWSFSGHGGG